MSEKFWRSLTKPNYSSNQKNVTFIQLPPPISVSLSPPKVFPWTLRRSKQSTNGNHQNLYTMYKCSLDLPISIGDLSTNTPSNAVLFMICFERTFPLGGPKTANGSLKNSKRLSPLLQSYATTTLPVNQSLNVT